MNQKELAAHVVEVLNRAFQHDPAAMDRLLKCRTHCNEALAQDPTIQVVGDATLGYQVGILGLLNGIVGCDEIDHGYVAATYQTLCRDHGAVNVVVGQPCNHEGCTEKVILGSLVGFEVLDFEKVKTTEVPA
jgi:hypothetical protein